LCTTNYDIEIVAQDFSLLKKSDIHKISSHKMSWGRYKTEQ